MYLNWNYMSCTDMDRDVSKGSIQTDVARRTTRFMCIPIVPCFGPWKYATDIGISLIKNRCDKNRGSNKELSICFCKSYIIWEFVEERSNSGITQSRGFVEKRIPIRKKRITDLHCCTGCFSDRSPSVSFLWDCGKDIMISVEGEEGA